MSRLNRNLSEQIDFIRSSAARFDRGFEHEAKRIALSIRVLVHDGTGQSLLGQLGLRDNLKFVDSAQFFSMSRTFESALGLVVAVMEPGNEHYVPFHDACGSGKKVDFQEWWEETVLVKPVDFDHRERDGLKSVYTRKDFILGLSNKEGGAHVDPNPAKWWMDLRDQDFLGALEVPGGKPIGNLIEATVRQIAWELLETLKDLGEATFELAVDH